MMTEDQSLTALEKSRVWHPFTQMRGWCASDFEPVFIEEGRGEMLRTRNGQWFIDGNSSIWTNIHGHNHPKINAAIIEQLGRIAHSSFLGFTHAPAARLAQRLCNLWPGGRLKRVFFSDDGSTAIECALKMAIQFWQQADGGEGGRRTVFAAFDQAYHGDTSGASSLGGIGRFHDRFGMIHFPVLRIGSVEDLEALGEEAAETIAAVVIEPMVQGAAGIRLWPEGTLRRLRDWCDRTGALLIADEVMTGFGRTGRMFACEWEGVVPDFAALAKGLTGGYLPMAATLTTERIFEAFLGGAEETFYYGHSYSGSQLGCAAALASLDLFEEERTLERLAPKIDLMRDLLARLAQTCPFVGAARQCGLIAGIDLVKDKSSGERFPPEALAGAKACVAARDRGLLTRPIGDTIILMPPLCITEANLRQAIGAVEFGARRACEALVAE